MRVFVIALVTMGAAAFSSRPTAPRFHIFRHAQCERSLAPSMSMSKRSKRRVNAKNRASVSLSRTPLSREFLVVLDFEATCEQSGDYEHEIIEWPAVLLRTSDATVIDEFHTFVRPTVNTTLTPFCTELTGITQVQVDLAPTLGEALSLFQGWLSRHGLIGEATKEDDLVLESMSEIHELQGGVNFVEDVDVDEEENSKNEEEEDDEEEEEDDDEDDGEDLSVLNESHEDEEGNLGFASEGSPLSRTASARSFAICTDGPWDLRNFLAAEVARKGGAVLESHRRAPYLHTWVNLRWLHSAFYDRPRMGIAATLQHHGLVFEGRQHSGLDDTRNIARIAARMLADGCSMPVNDGLAEGLGSAAPRGGARGKGGKSKGRAPGAKGQSRKQRTAAAQARAKLIKSQAAQALKPTKT